MKRTLSGYMEAFELDRPSEYLMREWIDLAKQLERKNTELNLVLRKATLMAESENWPDRFPRVFGAMAELVIAEQKS